MTKHFLSTMLPSSTSLLLLLLIPMCALCLDPFSWGVVIGGGVASSAIYAGWDKVKCVGGFKECCTPDWIGNNFTHLEG